MLLYYLLFTYLGSWDCETISKAFRKKDPVLVIFQPQTLGGGMGQDCYCPVRGACPAHGSQAAGWGAQISALMPSQSRGTWPQDVLCHPQGGGLIGAPVGIGIGPNFGPHKAKA